MIHLTLVTLCYSIKFNRLRTNEAENLGKYKNSLAQQPRFTGSYKRSVMQGINKNKVAPCLWLTTR